MQPLYILDTETTGLQNASVCELAYLQVDHQLNILSEFHTLVDPEKPIEAGASNVHGIFDKDVVGKPTMQQIAAHFDGPIDLVAHNARFDKKVIQPFIPVATDMCTLAIARLYIKDTTNHKLETLQRELSLPPQKSHSALGDVHTVRDLLLYVVDKFDVPFEVLVARSREPKIIHTLTFGKHNGKALTKLPADYRDWLLSLPDLDKDLRYSLNRLKGI